VSCWRWRGSRETELGPPPPKFVTSRRRQRLWSSFTVDRSLSRAHQSQASLLAVCRRLITRTVLSPLDLFSAAERLPHSRASNEDRPTTRYHSCLPLLTQAQHTTGPSELTRPHRACPVAWEMQTEPTLGQEVARSGRHARLL
jgi:hypothetical protein